MGQKVNPHGLRVGIIRGWNSTWYSEKNYGDLLVEDNALRKYIKKKLYQSGVSKITIHRTNSRVKINIFTAKPGVVIGRGGKSIEDLKREVEALIKNKTLKIDIDITEIKNPETDAQLVAEDIAKQLENRVTFRRAMKQAMTRSMKSNITKGIKTAVAGRLGGADIARTEFYREGTIPLQTLRADIDYGFAEANTTYGKIGVKVWIYKGEILPVKADKAKKESEERLVVGGE
ncbi:MAG: 30S ribosomal protein S3 [Clostridiales bacterium]|jgi:small subunit ribosomal protein S3|nr:30S ribosomal protein S3 [Clostridiales bacterium]